MKNIILLICITLCICSCEESSHKTMYVCNCMEQEKLQKFVSQSIKSANNMSDEEMEDVIEQLRIDGTKIFCKPKPVWVFSNNIHNIDWKKEKYDTCSIIMMEY